MQPNNLKYGFCVLNVVLAFQTLLPFLSLFLKEKQLIKVKCAKYKINHNAFIIDKTL